MHERYCLVQCDTMRHCREQTPSAQQASMQGTSMDKHARGAISASCGTKPSSKKMQQLVTAWCGIGSRNICAANRAVWKHDPVPCTTFNGTLIRLTLQKRTGISTQQCVMKLSTWLETMTFPVEEGQQASTGYTAAFSRFFVPLTNDTKSSSLR